MFDQSWNAFLMMQSSTLPEGNICIHSKLVLDIGLVKMIVVCSSMEMYWSLTSPSYTISLMKSCKILRNPPCFMICITRCDMWVLQISSSLLVWKSFSIPKLKYHPRCSICSLHSQSKKLYLTATTLHHQRPIIYICITTQVPACCVVIQ